MSKKKKWNTNFHFFFFIFDIYFLFNFNVRKLFYYLRKGIFKMSSFNANTQAFNVMTENALAEVLSHYNSEFIFSIVNEAMKSRFTQVPIASIPNAVGAWEQNFKAIIANYGSDNNERILTVRNDTYDEIIQAICKEFNLNFTIDDSVDKYSAAFYLYDLLVCNFIENLTIFFANFIYKERASLYDSLGLSELKKNKDSSTIYGKKVYKDIKLAVISANIDMVITQICSMDIPFQNVISTICGNNSDSKRYFLSIISDNGNFFNHAYVSVLQSDIRPDIITHIRFKLQELIIEHDQAITNMDIAGANK